MTAILPARVHEIVALDEQVLRNLSITDAYHRLALDMAELVLAGALTWPGFATWASKQAGVFIRQEGWRSASSLPPSAKMLMDRLDPEERHTVQQVLGGIARFIVAGSVSVFEELGFAFASFAEAFEH